MKIILQKAGKKFFQEWIFRNLDLELPSMASLAILGPNGSGKSTLLQLISGSLIPTEGTVEYINDNGNFEADEIFSHISFAAPYLELTEEFTLTEIIDFHFRFKKRVNNLSTQEMIGIANLDHAKNKSYKYFSSGMKQRVKLVLAFLSDTGLILLDEPCSNLDPESIKWYQQLIEQYSANKTIVVCSNNQTEEFGFCKQQINLMDWKK